MSKWQVVEKEDFGTDWHQVRYEAYAMGRFDTEKEALDAAKKYLTNVNCTNALTQDEVKRAAEAFMMIKKGDKEECFMGVLDGKDWYFTYPKDIQKMVNGKMEIIHHKGDRVGETNYYELEGKTEVAVREVRGT